MATKVSPLQELLTLIEDYHDFNPTNVERYPGSPTSLQFCQQISKGLPCVYATSDLVKGHQASHWTRSNLIKTVTEKVEVAVTPTGRADSLCSIPRQDSNETVFLQPANEYMTLETLFNRLDSAVAKLGPVYYLQSQNGNLNSTALSPLFNDLPPNFSFAQDVLGDPEAVNIWIGDERSVTSAHRDPYENLYMVLRGAKIFTLWPPVDEVALDGRYVYDAQSSSFSVVLDDDDDDGRVDNNHSLESGSANGHSPNRIPWVTVDPLRPRHELNAEHPLYQHARPQTVVVEAGDMLYLPSGWYHHVAQRCGKWDDGSSAPCIAVNYWYDHDYEGEKYVMRQLIGRLARSCV